MIEPVLANRTVDWRRLKMLRQRLLNEGKYRDLSGSWKGRTVGYALLQR